MQRRIPPSTELHGRYRRPKQLARNTKNLGKTRVFSGQDRNRTTREIPGNGAFQYPARREIRRAQKTHSRRLETVSLRTIVFPNNRLLAHPHITGSFTRSRVNRLLAHLLAHMQFPRDLLAHLLAHHNFGISKLASYRFMLGIAIP